MPLKGEAQQFQSSAFVFLTYNQIDVLVIVPHMFFKQVNYCFKGSCILEDGTNISARFRHNSL